MHRSAVYLQGAGRLERELSFTLFVFIAALVIYYETDLQMYSVSSLTTAQMHPITLSLVHK